MTEPGRTPLVIAKTPGYMAKLHRRLASRRPAWVVYSPANRDYPRKWVARMHVRMPVPKPTRFVIAHDTLEELRETLPPELRMVPRHPSDPYGLIETWL